MPITEKTQNWATNDARNEIRCNSELLGNTMRELAWCCRDVILDPPFDGPDLGSILIAYQFKGILDELGLAIVPKVPTKKMQAGWRQHLFHRFHDRYRALIAVVWEVDGPLRGDTKERKREG